MSDPNLDERFNLPEDTNPDDVLRKLLGVEDEDATEEVTEDGSED